MSIENLLSAWQGFLKGKRNKKDVQEFQFHLMGNILSLHDDLINNCYKHDCYECFSINDPKPRTIHKATVRDRLVHHATHKVLYPFFQKTFIADSFSCQNYKGTHRALERFLSFGRITSKNNTRTCWILKCDIKKFFASVDQDALMKLLDERIRDKRIVGLLNEVVSSFKAGLPLGNLTSQLFSNVYMNEFDGFVKHHLRAKHYVRYADDFIVFSNDKIYLENLISRMKIFLQNQLKLTLHPNKVFIKRLSSGMDFLGWVHFFDHRVLRTATRKKMFRKLKDNKRPETLNSYFGLLSHGSTGKIKNRILSSFE